MSNADFTSSNPSLPLNHLSPRERESSGVWIGGIQYHIVHSRLSSFLQTISAMFEILRLCGAIGTYSYKLGRIKKKGGSARGAGSFVWQSSSLASSNWPMRESKADNVCACLARPEAQG